MHSDSLEHNINMFKICVLDKAKMSNVRRWVEWTCAWFWRLHYLFFCDQHFVTPRQNEFG